MKMHSTALIGKHNGRSYNNMEFKKKIINMVIVMYSNNRCAVLNGDGTLDLFIVKSGVKQGYNRSGFFFIIVIYWIMNITTKNHNYGIRWKFTAKLDDLDNADDIALLSSSKQHPERKSEILDNTSRSTGLIINSAKKTQMANLSTPEEVDTFIYLCATVRKE